MTGLAILGLISLAIWVTLVFQRGGFWKADQVLDEAPPSPGNWPKVVTVIPARDEALTIGRTVGSLLAQDYPARLDVIVVDDNSSDGTADEVRAAAEGSERVRIVTGKPLAAGWSGKVWAMAQGVEAAKKVAPDADFLLLTDADIVHDRSNVKKLVAKAEAEGLALTSLMVRLRTTSYWEKLLIPAFIFFFQKLYPFPWVNDPERRVAAAAGGCMLVRREKLETSGGLEPIKSELIDDCALAALIKPQGPIWLGLDDKTHSLRAYEDLGAIWRMVARTAFVQLNHSALALVGTVLGMMIIYLVPPLALIGGFTSGDTEAQIAGALAWAFMAMTYARTLRYYERSTSWSLLLPLAGVLYTLMTIDSARRHWSGSGGAWKGRTYP